MFGNLSFDDILGAVRRGEELVVPVSPHSGFGIDSISNDSKVSKPSGFMDFLKVAKRRQRKVNPIAPNQADYVQWVVYDRVSNAAAATVPAQQSLFTIPIGTGGKTKVDTNLEIVSQLIAPYWMNVTAIGFYFNNNVIGPDLDGYLNSEYMEFWVTNKTYLEGPLQCFPPGAGRFGSSTLGTMAAAATSWAGSQGNGWPHVANMFDVRLPAGLDLGLDQSGNRVVSDGMIGITILQGQNFKVLLKADAGGFTLAANNAVPIPGTGITIACYLHGVLSRSVQ